MILYVLYLCLGLNLLMFIPAYFFRTDKLTDISYALSFIVALLTIMPWSRLEWPTLLLLIMITLWAGRLGIYLLIRIHKIKKDSRFDTMRQHPWQFARFWILQGLTVWVVLIPSIFFVSINPVRISALSYLGLTLFLTGLLIEAAADYQKYVFINQPSNQGQWIATGLWKYSRHPNYLGEITVWIGVYIFCVASLTPVIQIISLISPIYIASLIIFVSGIPLLEKSADARWGSHPQYQKYKSVTGVLLPKI
jgi:steroid 5-alpha reductase family enzyme